MLFPPFFSLFSTFQHCFGNKKSQAFLFHCGIVLLCVVYISFGALIFYKIEKPFEIAELKTALGKLEHEQIKLFEDTFNLIDIFSEDEQEFRHRMADRLLQYEDLLLKRFVDPVTANYFDSLLFNDGTYMDMWTLSSSYLLATTTIIPVGFGFVTPRTTLGKGLLVLYASVGIPLALVTISDIGHFFCNFIFGFFKNSTKKAITLLLVLIFLYPVIMGQLVWNYSGMSLADSYYYCIICIFTIGYGDILPPLPVPLLILFLACGVMLMTVSVEVLGSNAIHHIHYMGRQVHKASHAATKFIQMAHAKMNINQGLGLGMSQLNNFAKMGFMFNTNKNISEDYVSEQTSLDVSPPQRLVSVAYEPGIALDYVDLAAIDG